jgi:hypothetical protein
MKKKASFEYDPAEIPKLKSELDFMLMQIRDEAYQKGLDAERDRIIKVIEDSLGNMTAEVVVNLIKGTK